VSGRRRRRSDDRRRRSDDRRRGADLVAAASQATSTAKTIAEGTIDGWEAHAKQCKSGLKDKNEQKACKEKYGNCQELCWYYRGAYVCPGCFQQSHAQQTAKAVADYWSVKKGLLSCQKELPKPKDFKTAKTQLAFKAATMTLDNLGELAKKLPPLNGMPNSVVATGINRFGHFLVIRAGAHVVRAGEGFAFLCSIWAAVCSNTPPGQGQKCASSRLVVGCATTTGTQTGWGKCSDLQEPLTFTLPNFA